MKKHLTRAVRALRTHPDATCVYIDPDGQVFLPTQLPLALSHWGGDASQLTCITRTQITQPAYHLYKRKKA